MLYVRLYIQILLFKIIIFYYKTNLMMFKTILALGLATLAFSDLESADDIMKCDKNQDGKLQLEELQCVGNASGTPIPQWGFAQLQTKLGKGRAFQRSEVIKGQEKLSTLKAQSLNFQNQIKNNFQFNEKIGAPELKIDASKLNIDLKSTLKGSIGRLQTI